MIIPSLIILQIFGVCEIFRYRTELHIEAQKIWVLHLYLIKLDMFGLKKILIIVLLNIKGIKSTHHI